MEPHYMCSTLVGAVPASSGPGHPHSLREQTGGRRPVGCSTLGCGSTDTHFLETTAAFQYSGLS